MSGSLSVSGSVIVSSRGLISTGGPQLQAIEEPQNQMAVAVMLRMADEPLSPLAPHRMPLRRAVGVSGVPLGLSNVSSEKAVGR